MTAILRAYASLRWAVWSTRVLSHKAGKKREPQRALIRMRVIDFGRQHSQEKCASKFCACQEKLHVKKKKETKLQNKLLQDGCQGERGTS